MLQVHPTVNLFLPAEMLRVVKSQFEISFSLLYTFATHPKTDLARAVVRRLGNGQTFTGTIDQKINPLYKDSLIACLETIIENPVDGSFHLGALDYTSPYEFAQMVADALGLNRSLIASTTFEEFSKTRPATRPKDSWLDTTKFRKTYGQELIQPLVEGITAFAQEIRARR